MHYRFFFKKIFFFMIALSVVVNTTHSIAGSSPLSKETSILSVVAKTVVVGLAFGSIAQILVSSFPQKQKNSLDKHQDLQENSHLCVPSNDGIFYVGQHNLTRCLEQHPQGTFIFIERVNFTQFPENEKEKYPLYNYSVPFSGSLTMFPYSFDHFNITRFKLASMFSRAHNAIIRANLTYPRITSGEDCYSLYCLGAAGVINFLSGHNTIEMELDSASIVAHFGDTGCVATTLKENSVNHIFARIKNYCNVSAAFGGGGIISDVELNSTLDLSTIIDTVAVNGGEMSWCGGILGSISAESRVKVNVKGFLINVTGVSSYNNSGIFSALYGEVNNRVNHIKNTDIQIDNVIIDGGVTSVGSVIYGVIPSQSVLKADESQKIILIQGMHVDIHASRFNAIGVATTGTRGVQEIPPMYFLSINGTLGSPSYIFGVPAPQGTLCEGSMIDWSGVNLNTKNLGCTGALELETLHPEHWRQAHRLVAAELCQDKENCFYINEDLVALVKDHDNTFFLVTRQRYPYNHANDGQGVVRVTQYILDNPQHDPIINKSFAINGTRLFTNGTKILLPVEHPLSTSVTDDHQLLMLYGKTGNLKVASMPLMATGDTTYMMHAVKSNAVPVQIDNGILWLNQEGDLLAYNVSNAVSKVFSKKMIFSNAVNLIGAQGHKDYVYTAQLENGTAILIAKFFNDGRQDVNWTSSLPFIYDHISHQLQISNDDKSIVSFPHVVELYQPHLSNRSYMTVKLPHRGGLGEWQYSDESFSKFK